MKETKKQNHNHKTLVALRETAAAQGSVASSSPGQEPVAHHVEAHQMPRSAPTGTWPGEGRLTEETIFSAERSGDGDRGGSRA